MPRRPGKTAFAAALTAMIQLLALSGASAVSDQAILAKKPPKSLTKFGFFTDTAAHLPAERVLPYDLTTPLFSDHAIKLRFVYVPSGETAAYRDHEVFEFPVGTALIKTFAYPGGSAGPSGDLRLIETRLLLRSQSGWHAWAYLWNEDQTDAILKVTGARVPVTSTTPDGEPIDFTYSVPNKNQCKGCHSLHGEVAPIGPKSRNLNRDLAYADRPENQLAKWTDRAILTGTPDLNAAPKVPDWRDETEDLNARARAWLDVNCAHCHRREGPASNSGLFLTWGESDPVALGIRKRPVAAGRGSGGLLFDIAPGDPDGSILLHRIESVEPGVMMPELGRSLPDDDAVRIIRSWISAMR